MFQEVDKNKLQPENSKITPTSPELLVPEKKLEDVEKVQNTYYQNNPDYKDPLDNLKVESSFLPSVEFPSVIKAPSNIFKEKTLPAPKLLFNISKDYKNHPPYSLDNFSFTMLKDENAHAVDSPRISQKDIDRCFF